MNLSLVLITQNIFFQGRNMRTINLNIHYIILMSNPRVAQISTLAQQVGLGKVLMEAYIDAVCNKPYGYLVVNLSPHNSSGYKLFSNIFPQDDAVNVYVKA